MLTAYEFYQTELEAPETPKERWARKENRKQWEVLDYMDFSERYADYVCNYEKKNS